MKIHVALVFCLCAVTGCQTYRSLPLDTDAHERDWAARNTSDDRVKAYTDQLESLNPDHAEPFDPSDGLSLREAELVALVFNPDLRTARLRAKVPLLGAKEAGRWDDPDLSIDLLRVAESVKNPWIVGTSLSFTIPISGRLGVEKEKAFAEADVELRRALLAEWTVLGDLRIAWAKWSSTTERIALIEAYLKRLDLVIDLAKKQRQANRIGAPELRILQLEGVTRVGQLNRLRIDEQRRKLVVKALLGLNPKAPLDMRPGLPLELPVSDETGRLKQLRDHNLQLAVARAEYEVADHAFRLEIRKQYPDLVIGPGYENEEGMSRAGVVLSIPIPLLNQNRRAVAESRAARDATKAAYESKYEGLVGTLARAELDVRAAKTRSAYLEGTVAPLVDEQMRDLQRLGKLGNLDVLVILDALTRTLETKLQVLDAKVEEAAAVTELRSLLRPLNTPSAQETTDEKE